MTEVGKTRYHCTRFATHDLDRNEGQPTHRTHSSRVQPAAGIVHKRCKSLANILIFKRSMKRYFQPAIISLQINTHPIHTRECFYTL